MTTWREERERGGKWYRCKSQTTATGPGEDWRIEQKQNVYRIKRSAGGLGRGGGHRRSCFYDQGAVWRSLVQACIELLVATSDVAETGQVHVVCALLVIRADSSPAIRATKADVISRVVVHVDDRGVGRLSCKVLVCTLVWTRRLVVDLGLITTIEGCDPIVWPVGERNTARNADIGAGVVDRQLLCGITVAVVTTDLGPLKDVVTVGDPRRDLHVHANALMCVTTVEAVHGAISGVALALDD